MRSRWTLLTLAGLAAGLAGSAAPAAAQAPPSIADQPAATLLLPYFEVDLANPAGANTLFEVNNASSTATLAHITVWSEMHVPVQTYNIYLTGYDAQQINVRDLLAGVVPSTASDGQDPSETLSPQGPFSQDINFASCAGQLPAAPLAQSRVLHIRNSLTGKPSTDVGGLCSSRNDGTNVARGYITVDTVNNCTLRTPVDAGYFISGGLGDATNMNILWGDYVYTNHLGGLESGDGSPLVHITANASDPELNTPGEYTFYGRAVNWTAADNREPLATTFGARFATVGTAGAGATTLTVWRDAKVNQLPFNCNAKPSWYPLGQTQIVMFDEQEHPEVSQSYPFAPQPPNLGITPFPAGTQRVRVGGTELPTTFSFGWTYLNLNTTVIGSMNPPENPMAAQGWVSVHQKGTGRYSTGWNAVMFDSAKTVVPVILPVP